MVIKKPGSSTLLRIISDQPNFDFIHISNLIVPWITTSAGMILGHDVLILEEEVPSQMYNLAFFKKNFFFATTFPLDLEIFSFHDMQNLNCLIR